MEGLLALEGGALALALPGCLAMEELGHLSASQLPPLTNVLKSIYLSAIWASLVTQMVKSLPAM